MTHDIWTIGHSTRDLDMFVSMLESFQIQVLVDVRRFPHSRRQPHFNTDELKRSLFKQGIRYDWMGMELGGFRKPRPDSPHRGLKESSFQGYADHMDTPTFQKSLASLIVLAKEKRVAYMCSEGHFKACHRRLISDALELLHRFRVHHIVDAAKEVPHEAFHAARVAEGGLVYAPQALNEFGGPSTA